MIVRNAKPPGKKLPAKAWPAEDERLFRIVWEKAKSASDAGRLLHEAGGRWYTRNAIIGKATRMGLMGDGKKVSTAPKTAKKPRVTKTKAFIATNMQRRHEANKVQAHKRATLEAELEAQAPLLGEHAISFMARDEGQCSWPVGHNDKGEMMCCGAKVSRHKREAPYCPQHTRSGGA